MLQRPRPASDSECAGSRNGRGHKLLGLPDRFLEIESPNQPGGDCGRKGAAGAVKVSGGNSHGGITDNVALPDQQIDTFSAAAVTAFDQNIARTERQYFAGLD